MRHSMIRSSVLAALMLCGTALPLTAQEKEPIKKEEPKIENYSLRIATDKPDAIYKKGETITFTAELLKDGKPAPGLKLSYRLSENGNWDKFLEAKSDKPLTATAKLDKPGWVSIEVFAIGPDGKKLKNPKRKNVNLKAEIGAMVDPLEITESAPEPKDFDAFWKAQRELLDKIPVEAERVEVPVPKKFQDQIVCYDVKVKCAGPKPVSGYLTMPQNAKKGSLPATVSFHGAGVRSAYKNLKGGSSRIAFDVNAHGILNGQPKEYYDNLNKGVLRGYRTQGKENRDTVYFKDMFLRVMRALDYVKSLPEWDGKTLVVHGGSQGGAQAIVAAALDPQVTFCNAGVPALGDHAGRLAGRRPGWPCYVNKKNLNDADLEVIDAVKYYDHVYFAKRIRCETYFYTGFVDFVCAPTSVYAAYNNLPKNIVKHIQTTPTGGHGAPGGLAYKRMNEFIQNAIKKNSVKAISVK